MTTNTTIVLCTVILGIMQAVILIQLFAIRWDLSQRDERPVRISFPPKS